MWKPLPIITLLLLACTTVACSSTSTQASPSQPCILRDDWMPYVVVEGDTFFSLAQRTGTTVEALLEGNCLANGSTLNAGQTLLVPQMLALGPASFYLIIPDDNGASGPAVGCGDSAVEVWRDRMLSGSTALDLEASVEELLSIRSPTYGQSGYAHAWSHTDLDVQSVTVIGDRVNIELTGTFSLIGTCADARMEAQLLLTVFQYTQVERAMIRINGQNMKQLFDMSGVMEGEALYTRSDL